MIKATAMGPDGRRLLVIGLSFGNLDRFRAAPLDTFITIEGKETGLPVDVMIFSCETEAAGAEYLAEFTGPATKGNVSPKLRS